MKFQRISGRIKTEPEDFKVFETPKKISDTPELESKYLVFVIKTVNVEKFKLIRRISEIFSKSPNSIKLSGIKDKRSESVFTIAVTKNTFHEKLYPKDIEKIPGVEIIYTYWSNTKISPGYLISNRFEITLRDCNLEGEELSKYLSENFITLEQKGFANYFGIQRFGITREDNESLSEYILKGEWGKFITELLRVQNPITDRYIKYLISISAWDEIYQLLGRQKSYEKDYVGGLRKGLSPQEALKEMPISFTKFLFQIFQSKLFNQFVKKRVLNDTLRKPGLDDWVIQGENGFYLDIKNSFRARRFPLQNMQKKIDNKRYALAIMMPGWPKNKREWRENSKILSEYGVKMSSLNPYKKFLRQTLRPAITYPENCSYSVDGNTAKLKFELQKGSYATVLINTFCDLL